MRMGNDLLACSGRARLAMSSLKRFGTNALKVEAVKPSENNYEFINTGLRSELLWYGTYTLP